MTTENSTVGRFRDARRQRRAATSLSILLSLATPVLAATPAPSERCSQLDAQLDSPGACTGIGQQLEELLVGFAGFGFSGTVLVATDQQVFLHEAYGLADVESGRPNSISIARLERSGATPMSVTASRRP